MIGMPGRASSPSWISTCCPGRHTILSTTMPEIGDETTIRVALSSADFIALYARSRWISRIRRSACAARALQIERRLQLLLLRLRLFQPLLVLLLIDAAEIDVLFHLETGVLDGIGRDRKLRIVLGARLFLLRAFLPNLLLEIAVLGPPVDGGLQLVLPVEFHEELPGDDERAAGQELRDDERIAARGRRADEPGRRDIMKMDGFNEAGHPQRFDERAARDLQRRRSLGRLVLLFLIGTARAHAADDGKRADQDHQDETKQQIRLFHGL